MTESELDALRDEMVARARAAHCKAAGDAWLEAIFLLGQHRADSHVRRKNQTPSARRKSLGYRPATSTAH